MRPTDSPRRPRRGRAASVAVLSILLAARPAHAQSRLDRVAWLAGCWRLEAGAAVIEEQWMAPRGGTMLGLGRTVRRDTLVEWEFLRIRAAGDTLVYEAQPSGQPRAEFRAPPGDGAEVAFANPTHDFPQRVVYRRAGADSLLARIEGTRGGQTRAIAFPYRRVPCP